jgi:hypothetical protein
MSQIDAKLNVAFESPLDGWLRLLISSQRRSLEIIVSDVTNDFLAELVSALCGVAVAQGQWSAIANEEPINVEVAFTRTGREVELKIARETGDGQSLVFEGDVASVVVPFWRALRRLQHDPAFAQWKRPFPSVPMNRLSELVGEIKVGGE